MPAKTMTLNLPEREMAALEELAGWSEMSKTHVMRAALRWYQMTVLRVRSGETVIFSGDKERIAMFIGPEFQGDDHAR